eukprot:8470330-Alexandrium_andersonii.AAC.1
MADRSARLGDFVRADPLNPRFRLQIRNLCEQLRRTHPRELRVSILRPCLAPRSFRFERLKR